MDNSIGVPKNVTERAEKARVLLVDDHQIVRKGLMQLINQEQDLMVCAEADDASNAFHAISTSNPSVLIVDLSLKDSDGIELIKNIKATYPRLPMLVLSMYDESRYCERALRAGAKGYIMKQEASACIVTGLRRILKGELYLSEMIKEKMIQQLISRQPVQWQCSLDRLSDRELEVLEMIGAGKEVKMIANALHLSPKTIETHRSHIKEKLNLQNARQVARFAVQWVAERAV